MPTIAEVYKRWKPVLVLDTMDITEEFVHDAWSAIRAAVEERCVWTREWFPSSVVIWHPACNVRSVFQSTLETLRPSHCPYCGREIECKETSDA